MNVKFGKKHFITCNRVDRTTSRSPIASIWRVIKTFAVVGWLSLTFQEVSAQEAISFDRWVSELRSEALSLGISIRTLEALDELNAPLQKVLEYDSSQPEFVQTFTRYLELRVTPNQVARGRRLLQEHRELLEEVSQRFGVRPHYLAAFWAIESNFGRNTGGFSVLQALATLAFDPRRANFFREQLLIALKIIDEGHISSAEMTGSWAGAMGQLQFMPTVFDSYAIDGDSDGRVDIWNSLPDIFYSAANFLNQSGWQGGERWGREVLLPSDFDYSLSGLMTRKTVNEWSDLGVSQVSGDKLPNALMSASIVLPAGAAGPAFLAYSNYRVTLDYNPSTFYALTVGHLADRFSGGGEIQRMPIDEEALSRTDITDLQTLLNEKGYDSGQPDGRVGRQTRAAIRTYQKDTGLPMDAYASRSLLEGLMGDI